MPVASHLITRGRFHHSPPDCGDRQAEPAQGIPAFAQSLLEKAATRR
ncbi:MAG: hypothetical protein VKL42_14070 [Snowella sp.]|nr:hypothetical protein [Snowella sp.]